MNTIDTLIRLRWLRTTLAALAVAASLASLAPAEASAQQRGRRTPAASTQQAAEPSSDGTVNIQTASAEQLQLLPGVGPAKAQAIVAARERRAFRRVEDIMRVRGIGRATFRRLRPMLSVEGPTTLTARPRAARPSRAAANDEVEDLDAQD